MKVVIIVPTYNERLNIGSLIDALQEQFRGIAHDMHVLVVDDSSPDGTADVVRAAMGRYANVHLLMGRKAGLGAAYIRGMLYAIQELGADAVFEMDADFSHDPRDVPRLLAELENSADFVIGSRHVRGGSIPADWSLLRKLNSVGGNWVARYVAGLYGIRDCTAGFRAIRASVLRSIDFGALRVKGYAFQVALLHQAITQGARVKEVPVHFIDRKAGQSKLGLRDIIEFVANAWWIRLRALQTFVRFAVVGASGTVVNLALFTVLLDFDMNKFVASPLAIEASILWNFLLNNVWTFRHRRTRASSSLRGLKFNLVSFVSLAVSFGTFIALSAAFRRASPQLLQLAGIVPAVFVNYFLNSYWTFRSDAEPEPEPARVGLAETSSNPP
ncbi:MAG TPA: glycosyltransferase family 2 protein [Steroidobacteraceae bacterium]|nr:glycosyltransferase family 2 protein [Steroidobacteraceae bacterium]